LFFSEIVYCNLIVILKMRNEIISQKKKKKISYDFELKTVFLLFLEKKNQPITNMTTAISSAFDFSDHSAVTHAIVSISNNAELARVATQIKNNEKSSGSTKLTTANQVLFIEKISDIVEADDRKTVHDRDCLVSICDIFASWSTQVSSRLFLQMFDLLAFQLLPNWTVVFNTARSMVTSAVGGSIDLNLVRQSTAAFSLLIDEPFVKSIFAFLAPQLHEVVLKVLAAHPDQEFRIDVLEALFGPDQSHIIAGFAERLVDHIDLRKYPKLNSTFDFYPWTGKTPLMIAANWQSVPLCRKFVAAGADVNGFIINPKTKEKTTGKECRPPLIMAAHRHDAALVDFLIKECGADYKLVDYKQFDVLINAVVTSRREDGDHRVIDYLLKLDPEHFAKVMTLEILADCVFGNISYVSHRVLGPMTLSHLLNHKIFSFDPELVRKEIFQNLHSHHWCYNVLQNWLLEKVEHAPGEKESGQRRQRNE
jgi:hypothetical protein